MLVSLGLPQGQKNSWNQEKSGKTKKNDKIQEKMGAFKKFSKNQETWQN